MANHPSALKRAKQSDIKRARNKGIKTRIKNVIREIRTAVETNSQELAQKNLVRAVSIIQKGTSQGVIHKRQASRKISRLARQVNKIKVEGGR